MTDIFVFGSNVAGRHGAGSAYHAAKFYGAIYGIGMGLQGHSYAIPTKDAALKVLSLDAIAFHVDYFETFALAHQQFNFMVVEIGCGLAGYMPQQIRPLFKLRPANVRLPARFLWSWQP